MSWSVQAAILAAEAVAGFVLGRVFIPYFRRIKTGKFDFYIGDRFAKDGSEPKFGGAVIMLCVLLGASVGHISMSFSEELGFDGGGERKAVLFSLGAVIMLCGLGLHEDRVKEKKLGIGLKPAYKLGIEYLVCLGLCLSLRLCGAVRTDLLLPFHLGSAEFGVLFYPIFPLLMTIGINMIKIHDCAGGKTGTGVDGLCAVTALIFSAGISSGLSFAGGSEAAQLLAVCVMGACAGFLFWGCYPAKLYLGESGSLALAGLLSAAVLLSGLYLLFVLAGIAFVIDGLCALLQYAVFKLRKKLLLKGYTLHEHLAVRGWGEFKIIGADALLSLAGTAAAIMFIVYSGKISI